MELFGGADDRQAGHRGRARERGDSDRHRGRGSASVSPCLDAPRSSSDQLYFDGNSQGAILGGALCAVARDFRRCVLGEAGMNYSTLLNRSIDFDLYKLVLDGSYPDPFTQLLGLNIVQMLWDSGETNGYAQRLTRRPNPRTPRKRVLLLGAVGDHQVSEFALQVEARTMGAAAHVPLVGPGRSFGGEYRFRPQADPVVSVAAVGILLFDTGAALSPLENRPPREGHDPHDDTPQIPAVQALKDTFWRPNGSVTDVCGGGRARDRSSDRPGLGYSGRNSKA